MFDYVRSEVPLPDGFVGEFQTKDFDSLMSIILIRADGRLMMEDHDWEEVPLEERPNPKFPMLGSFKAINHRWRDLEFHGDFRFYGGEKGDWHEYLARFTHGQLETIIVIPEEFYALASFSEGMKRLLSDATRAASAYADSVMDEAAHTLGQKLDDLIGRLPEDSRREAEASASGLIEELSKRLSAD